MPLDGLRAWIGEVERKLGMRTRVFLVLATIAIGGAGAAIYLAIDTREDAVSEGDVQELQERLEARMAAGATSVPAPEPDAVEPSGTEPEPEPEPPSQPGTEPGSGSKSGEGDGGAAAGGIGTEGGRPSKARLRELVEQVKEENEEAEAEQKAK